MSIWLPFVHQNWVEFFLVYLHPEFVLLISFVWLGCHLLFSLLSQWNRWEENVLSTTNVVCIINFNLGPILTGTFYSGFIWGLAFIDAFPFVVDGLVLLFLNSWFQQMGLELVYIWLLNWFQKEFFSPIFQASDQNMNKDLSDLKFSHVMPPNMWIWNFQNNYVDTRLGYRMQFPHLFILDGTFSEDIITTGMSLRDLDSCKPMNLH